jgi:hypothetical protein
MKILVGPLDIAGQISVDLQNPINPGIGGSEYHSIVLASLLSKTHDVTLWVVSGELEAAGIRIVSTLESDEGFGLQISLSSRANYPTPKPFPLIAISHHPFDSHILELPNRTLAVANVGDYQLKSNHRFAKAIRIPQIWLPVFLRNPKTNSLAKAEGVAFTVGHVSSLHPSKGFHDVLTAWMGYLAIGGKGTLEVLGGQSLYGLEESHPVLPVSKHYGEKLLAIMGGRVHETVKFLGRVPGDIASRIASWDLAVLNPKGFGESESVSMKDCWRESVPVIAGSRFGQRDYMRFFPTLASSRPRSISRIIMDLSQDQAKLALLQEQSRREYELLFKRGLQSGTLWEDVVAAIAEGKILASSGMPTTPPSTSLKLQILVEGLQIQLQVLASKFLSSFQRFRQSR